jgi:hypothetical protein
MATASASPGRFPGRLFLAAGLAIGPLGVLGYFVQLSMQRLSTPWYLPISATLGVLLIVVSLWQARTFWRILALVLVVLLAGTEWVVLLRARLPAYAGPVAADQSFPAFTTARADGTPFTQRDLAGDQNSVLVFFRGRW